MLSDDRPSHPMTCGTRFFLKGTVNQAALETAFVTEAACHPLFGAVTDGRTWHPRVEPGCRVEFAPIERDEVIARPPIDLRKDGTPTVLVLLGKGAQVIIEIRFHHSTCDGLAVFQFFERSLLRYRAALSGEKVILPELSASLAARDQRPPANWRARLQRLRRILKFFTRLPVMICETAGQRDGSRPVPGNAATRLIVSPSDLSTMRAHTKRLGVTLNDWLLGALFRTIHRHWPRERGPLGWVRPVRIAVATSLREATHHGLSACNVVSMVFLDRTARQSDRLGPLVASIAREMNHVKGWQLGTALVEVFRYTMCISGLSRLMLMALPRSATAVLTNLGCPFRDSPLNDISGKVRVGDLVLESLETWPPVRRGTSLAVSVNTYGGILSVTARYDSQVISKAYAARLAADFVEEAKAIGYAQGNELAKNQPKAVDPLVGLDLPDLDAHAAVALHSTRQRRRPGGGGSDYFRR